MSALATEPFNDTAGKTIGEKMQGGIVFGGISPDTGKPLLTTPEDANAVLPREHAESFADNFSGYGYPKGAFRLATTREMQVLLDSKETIGGFTDQSYWTKNSGEKGVTRTNVLPGRTCASVRLVLSY